jgi:hypothetical protein
MSRQPSPPAAHSATLAPDEVRGILGDIDDGRIIAILALKPSLADLEEAAIWATGDGDVLAKSGRPLGSVAAAIVDIITADEEEPPPVQ